MEFEIVFQNNDRGDRIDGLFFLPSPHRAPKTPLRFEARKPLILKLHLDAQSLGKTSREVSRMPRHGTFRSVHVDGKPHNKALYNTASECVSDSLHVGAK